LQAILEKIRASGAAQICEIETNAQSRTKAILAQARMEAHQIEEEARTAASIPAAAERARILHLARLDALYFVGSVRENLVDAAISQTRERLASYRSDPSYPMVLRKLVDESLRQLKSTDVEGKPQLLADPRDQVGIQNILEDMKLNIPVRYELKCWGGLIARSEDGCVVVINTLESRLEHATVFLRHSLAMLFEEEQSTIEDMVHA